MNPKLPLFRQYDKLLAVAVLIVLLLSLFYLTHSGDARRQEEKSYIRGLEGLKPKAETAQAMDLSTYEEAAKALRSPLQLDTASAQQAGFLLPESRVACTNAVCLKPIPYSAAKCPFCEASQPIPDELRTDRDSDKDEIPDSAETQLGLNPQDASDAKADFDKDGFPNIEEYLAKTDMKDPKSHPALVNLLRVKELRGKVLPFIFTGVNKMPDGKFQLVFNVTQPARRTYWVREGEAIGDTGYGSGKVEVKFEERANPNMPGIKTRVDVSTVVVKRLSDNKEVTLRINEGSKSTDVEAVIVLPLDNTEYTVVEGGKFKVRDETYRVVAVDTGTTTVVIENEASGQQKVIRKLD